MIGRHTGLLQMESQVRTCCRIKVHFTRDLKKQVSLSNCVTTTRTWKQTQGKGIQLSTFPMGKSCGLSLSKPESKSVNPPPLLAGRCLVVCQRTSLSRVMCLVASSFEDIFFVNQTGRQMRTCLCSNGLSPHSAPIFSQQTDVTRLDHVRVSQRRVTVLSALPS